MARRNAVRIGLGCLLVLPISGIILADEPGNEDALRCISAIGLRSTKIVDDANILFYIRGNSIFRNTLRERCIGLAHEGRFQYRRTSNSLCRSDFIEVLHADATGFRAGRMCRLGYFHELSEEDAEAILNPVPRPIQPVPLPTAEPEEVIEEADESH